MTDSFEILITAVTIIGVYSGIGIITLDYQIRRVSRRLDELIKELSWKAGKYDR